MNTGRSVLTATLLAGAIIGIGIIQIGSNYAFGFIRETIAIRVYIASSKNRSGYIEIDAACL